MLLELGKLLSLLLSILSLYALLASAFFVPSTAWDDRLLNSLERIVLAACICFASGLLFQQTQDDQKSKKADPASDVLRTLPVQLFFWAVGGMALLFTLSWYLEQYYVPLLWKNQPH